MLSGAAEADVYAGWRDRTRERVAEARRRYEAPVSDPPTTIDVPAAVAASRAGSRRFGPHDAVDRDAVTDVVLAFDQNITFPAAVLVESMLANASGPLRLWVLGRGLPATYPDWLAAAFPSLPITYLPCDQISYGPDGRPRRIPKRITISTMDRLLLPLMLDDVDRVVYLDVDTVMLDDVCRLARTDLGGGPVAARDSNVSEASEWRRAGRRLRSRRPPTCADAWAPPRLRAAALNAGVLVMDLDRMRRDGFTATTLGWVERYGLQRPGQHARLRRAGTRRARSALERDARPRGRHRPERHPLGQLRQAVGARPDFGQDALAAVCGAAAAARRPAADGRPRRRSRRLGVRDAREPGPGRGRDDAGRGRTGTGHRRGPARST